MRRSQLSFARSLRLFVFVALLLSGTSVFGQTTGFTYQGRLTDGGAVANGNYDLQFALFDNLSGGTQIGTTQTVSTVSVSGGVFTVQLDFGASAFPGANRFLEISVRPSGGGGFTTLTPRQPMSSTPYAIRSLNATSADAVTVNGVPGGSGNYVQNTTSQQGSSNFNISGNGTAAGTLSGNIVNGTTQFNIGGNRVLSNAGLRNLFAGVDVGGSNTVGNFNALFGSAAGTLNTTGSNNSFFGSGAGFSNTTGSDNSFFGLTAGFSNTTGHNNTAIGSRTDFGSANLTNATAIGANARVTQSNSLVLGSFNALTGEPDTNVGIGTTAPSVKLDVSGSSSNDIQVQTTGDTNAWARINMKTTNQRWAMGTSQNFNGDQLYLLDDTHSQTRLTIQPNGGAISFPTGNVGIGTTTPAAKLSVNGTGWFQGNDTPLTNGGSGVGVGFTSNQGYVFAFDYGANAAKNLILNGPGGNVGIGTTAPDQKLTVNGQARIAAIPGAQGQEVGYVCFDIPGNLLNCGLSSLRYKTNVQPFRGGLDIVRHLRPINFTWKGSGLPDVGLAAEDVAKVAPTFTFTDSKGEVTGVKYDRLNIVLINAIKEQQNEIEAQQLSNQQQQAQIKQQQAELTQQQQEINALKKLVCRSHRGSSVCR